MLIQHLQFYKLQSFTIVLEVACVALLNSYHSFPSSQGRTVKTKLKHAVMDILDNCGKFVKTLHSTVGTTYPQDNHPLGEKGRQGLVVWLVGWLVACLLLCFIFLLFIHIILDSFHFDC